MIDPLTGRPIIRTIRTVTRFSMHEQSSPPRFQYLRVPRVGNLVGSIKLLLPDALTTTVPSSVLEVYVSVVLDGAILPVELEIEDFYAKADDS